MASGGRWQASLCCDMLGMGSGRQRGKVMVAATSVARAFIARQETQLGRDKGPGGLSGSDTTTGL